MSNEFYQFTTAPIAAGANITGDIDLRQVLDASGLPMQAGLTPFALSVPSGWTAANLTFQMSLDNKVSWSNVYDAAGNEYTVQAAASRVILLDSFAFAIAGLIRIRSGTSGSPVTQSSAVTLEIGLRRAYA